MCVSDSVKKEKDIVATCVRFFVLYLFCSHKSFACYSRSSLTLSSSLALNLYARVTLRSVALAIPLFSYNGDDKEKKKRDTI